MKSIARRTDRKLLRLNKLHAWLPTAAVYQTENKEMLFWRTCEEELVLFEIRWLLKGLQMMQVLSFRWFSCLLCSYCIPDGCSLYLDFFSPQKVLQEIASFLMTASSSCGWALAQPCSWRLKTIWGRLMQIFTQKVEQPSPFGSRGILHAGDSRRMRSLAPLSREIWERSTYESN